MSKLPIPSGPPGIARRFVVATQKPVERPTQERHALAKAALKTAEAGLTKAQKVKAWRLANPEAYAEQKRRFAEKRHTKLKES